MNQKVAYFLRSARNSFQKEKCPNCLSEGGKTIDQKYLVTKLIKCDSCKLNFRYPVDDEGYFEDFYQDDYKDSVANVPAIINELPSDDKLRVMMAENFPTQRDHSNFIFAFLKDYRKKVIDYGSSWGYSVFHLKKSGFDAEGFEISKPRAEFGSNKLGIKIYYKTSEIRTGNDLIMSNHVIEHLPKVQDFIRLAASKLTEEGIFLSFCPNGSPEFKEREPDTFHVNWGFLHPNYLDVEFAKETFKRNPYIILTGDWNYDLSLLNSWDGRSQVVGENRSGKELLIAAKPNIYL